MSDFGATLTLTKKSNQQVTAEDKVLLESELEKIKNEKEFFDFLGDPFIFDLLEMVNDNTMFWVRLSEYWYGDGDNEENFQSAKDNDINQAIEIGRKLEKTLGNIFSVKPDFQNW